MDYFCKVAHGLFKKIAGNFMGDDAFVYGMRVFVCFLNICPFWSVNFELTEGMKPEINKNIYVFCLNVSIILAQISYWIATLKKP